MTKFAEFDPEPPQRASALPVVVRPAVEADVDAVARLFLLRNGGDAEAVRAGALADVERNGDGRLLLVAELADEVVGYGRARWMDYERSGVDAPPSGWYLTGVVVAPEHRRRGVGRALTLGRIDALRDRADSIRYFANVRNRVSIELHAALGFREVQRPLTVPGLSFTGGVGALFELAPTPERTTD